MCCTTTSKAAYRATIKQYSQTVVLKAGIQQSQQRFYHLVDKFNRSWFGNTVTVDGSTTIILAGIDKYIFNQFAGDFKLTIVDGNKQAVQLTIGGREYGAVIISFKDIRDEFGNPHNVIG